MSIVITILFRFLAGIIVYVIIFAVAGAAIVGIALTWYVLGVPHGLILK